MAAGEREKLTCGRGLLNRCSRDVDGLGRSIVTLSHRWPPGIELLKLSLVRSFPEKCFNEPTSFEINVVVWTGALSLGNCSYEPLVFRGTWDWENW